MLYPLDDNERLELMASPEHFTMMFVNYVKGQGMAVRAATIPGSRIQMYMLDMAGSELCDCHPGLGWNMQAFDPETGRTIVTRTLDTHVAIMWMQKPDEIFDIDISGMETTEELVYVPEGEPLQTVLNDYAGAVTGGITISEASISDDDIERFFNQE